MIYATSTFSVETDLPLPLPQAKKPQPNHFNIKVVIKNKLDKQFDEPIWFHSVEDKEITWLRFGRTRQSYIVETLGIGSCRISNKGLVFFNTFNLDPTTIGTFLCHHILPLALSLKSRQIIHCGTLSLDGYGFILLGPQGAGKSTLATSFYADKDVEVFGDDSIEIKMANNSMPTLVPISRELRLDPITLSEIDTPFNFETGMYFGKVRIPLKGLLAAPRPLKAIYYLKNSAEDIKIQPKSQLDSMASLLQQTFRLETKCPLLLNNEISQSHLLLQKVKAFDLIIPKNLNRLIQVKSCLKDHFRQLIEEKPS